MNISEVLIAPVLTEKSSLGLSASPAKYTFKINKNATKTNVKDAFEAIYGVRPERVNVVTRKPVTTRRGTAHPGFTRLTKIAIVTLPAGVTISVTGEKEEKKQKKEKKSK